MRIAAFFLFSLWLCCWSFSAAKANTVSFVLSGTIVNERTSRCPEPISKLWILFKAATADVYGKFCWKWKLRMTHRRNLCRIQTAGTTCRKPERQKKCRPQNGAGQRRQKLNETIVVGFGSQKKNSVTGSIATIKVSDLQQVATPSLSNAIGAGCRASLPDKLPVSRAMMRPNVFIRGLGTFTVIQPYDPGGWRGKGHEPLNVQEVEVFRS